jgi:hypothetical protein
MEKRTSPLVRGSPRTHFLRGWMLPAGVTEIFLFQPGIECRICLRRDHGLVTLPAEPRWFAPLSSYILSISNYFHTDASLVLAVNSLCSYNFMDVCNKGHLGMHVTGLKLINVLKL